MFLGEMFEMLNQLVFYSSNLKLSIKPLKINIQRKRTSTSYFAYKSICTTFCVSDLQFVLV